MSGKRCVHPKSKRSLLHGYDVVCECGEAIGRVALFPCAVLTAEEAKAVLLTLPPEGAASKPERDATAKLRAAEAAA